MSGGRTGRGYPGEEADRGRDSEGGGVVAEPGEIKRYFDPEIFRDLISGGQTMLDIQRERKIPINTERLQPEQFPHPAGLETLQADIVVEREDLPDQALAQTDRN